MDKGEKKKNLGCMGMGMISLRITLNDRPTWVTLLYLAVTV